MNDSIRLRLRRIVLMLIGTIVLIVIVLLLLPGSGNTVNPSILGTIIVLLVVTGLLLIVSWNTINRTITELDPLFAMLTLTANEISRGNLEQTIPAEAMRLRELREVAEAINAMAARTRSDITELKRLERVRSEFLGNVSHELRTPIFSVQGYIETLIDGAVDDPTVRDDFLQKAHHNVLRLHTLLTDLIEISRIESGEMKMSFRYFDAVKHFHDVVEELRPTAEMAGVQLHFAVQDGHGHDTSVFGDRERLKQVVINLVENAIKYNRPDGHVTVELDLDNGQATVRVRDTGIGIPTEDLSRIFERFYRVNKDRSRAVGGSGLGLAIVKHILEAHRTRIHVESELGHGTVFSFTLKR